MNILLYALATIAAGALAVRVPLGDREDPVRRAFAVFTSVLCVSYFGFTLYLLPGLGAFKYLHAGAGAFLPLALLVFVDRFFWQPGAPHDPRVRTLSVATPLVTLAFAAIDAVFYRDTPRASIPEVVFAVYVFGAFLVPLHRLWQFHESTEHRVERARIRYLAALAGLAIGFSGVEALARSIGGLPDQVSFWAFPAMVQGAFPPLGAIFASIFVYFLYQIITVYRLLDLAEIFSRMAAVAVSGSLLVGIDALSAASLLGEYPIHGTFQVFLASCLFLLAYDPLRKQLETWAGRIFNRRGQRLQETLQELDVAMVRALSIDGLTHEMLTRFVASGRIPVASIFLWDEERRTYRLVAERGTREQPPIMQVARQPFTDGFASGQRSYIRAVLARQQARHTGRAEDTEVRLRLLEAMNADVAVPFMSGDVVIGWLTLRDEEELESFTAEDVARLVHTAARASVILENLHGFEKLKEEHRLAALGTMAAGLAHEIRNPLAGIKGAAQYLQAGREGPDAEMVKIIVDEVDRLNQVVSQFLDYARPMQLHLEETDVASLVGTVMGVINAQGLPPNVRLAEEHALDRPPLPVDAPKLKQVLLNLCQNGLQAMKHGGTLTLHTRVGRLRDPKARYAPAIEVAVEDTGSGIAPEDLDKLFVPFFTTRHDGTGLGLAISRRIVQAHGGELDVSSTVGKGTTFTVRIPLRSPSEPAIGADEGVKGQAAG
ncbi:MAG: ATP-binding protein [Pseudomonadota bacterium]|nr:ATP-binding protein [Pseudomonadota bacterium]